MLAASIKRLTTSLKEFKKEGPPLEDFAQVADCVNEQVDLASVFQSSVDSILLNSSLDIDNLIPTISTHSTARDFNALLLSLFKPLALNSISTTPLDSTSIEILHLEVEKIYSSFNIIPEVESCLNDLLHSSIQLKMVVMYENIIKKVINTRASFIAKTLDDLSDEIDIQIDGYREKNSSLPFKEVIVFNIDYS